MENEPEDKDDGLYDLIDIGEDDEDDDDDSIIETRRTRHLMYDPTPINWRESNILNPFETKNNVNNVYLTNGAGYVKKSSTQNGLFAECPKCNLKNLSSSSWCLSCGLFLIKRVDSLVKSSLSADDVQNYLSVPEKNRLFCHLDLRSVTEPNAGEQVATVDLDVDLDDNYTSCKVNVPTNHPLVPPLDLSSLNSDRRSKVERSQQECIKKKEEEKENAKRHNRYWNTSSLAWKDVPVSTLHKKPASAYNGRVKLNSYINKFNNEPVNTFESSAMQLSIECNSLSSQNPINTNYNYPGDDGNYDSELVNGANRMKPTSVTEFDEEIYEKSVGISQMFENVNVSPWQCMPAEIWIKMMKYLPHSSLNLLQQTCRRLYQIGLDPQLWYSISLCKNHNITDEVLVNIAKRQPKELHFSNCVGMHTTVGGLKKMFEICGNGLRKLSFISCSKGALENDRFLLLSAKFCPNVSHVNASYLINLEDKTLVCMAEGFSSIVSLSLMGANSITNNSLKSLMDKHYKTITHVDLYGCLRLNSGTLKILEKCIYLKSLALGSIKKLGRIALIDLLSKLDRLTELDLRGTMNLVDDQLLRQICACCPKLNSLVLTNSPRIKSDGLIGLSESEVRQSLRLLDVCGCSQVDDDGLEAVLRSCHNLEDLDISCTGITGRSSRIFLRNSPPNLRILRVNNNKLISESELCSIINTCKKLKTVYLCGSTLISNWTSLEESYPQVVFKHD